MELRIISEQGDEFDSATEAEPKISQEINLTVITAVGVGGGGSSAVNRMIADGLQNVKFIVMNTDKQALANSCTVEKVALGQKLTGGLGAGGNPEVGEKAALEDTEIIKDLITGSDMVFITAGMGGGTGTGATPIVASIAKELGILTVAIVTRPFSFEGQYKQKLAQEGIDKLRKQVDTLITIPNDHLLSVAEKGIPIRESFLVADDVLRRGVQGIADIITVPGDINIDFADVKAIMKGQGDAIMGVGTGSGMSRAVDAATNAINNPILDDANIEGARGLLVNVTGGNNFSLAEFQEIMDIITKTADSSAHIIPGMSVDEELGDYLKVTVIATGFDHQVHQPESGNEQPQQQIDKESSYINLNDWSRIVGQKEAEQSEFSFQRGENGYQNNGRSIPAYYRYRRKQNEQ